MKRRTRGMNVETHTQTIVNGRIRTAKWLDHSVYFHSAGILKLHGRKFLYGESLKRHHLLVQGTTALFIHGSLRHQGVRFSCWRFILNVFNQLGQKCDRFPNERWDNIS